MRITDLQVDGFGIWNGLTVEGIEPKLTVFYGPNEAGKTTLLQFIRAILYGFASDRRARYLPPVYGGTGGGSIFVETRAGDFQVQRVVKKNRVNSRKGDLAVIDPNGSSAGASALDRLLGNVDESVFSNVFAIGLREIQELATLNDTDAARELYKLASGLDRVSLIDVMRSLRDERHQIQGDENNLGHVENLTRQLKDVERQIEKARSGARRWAKLASELSDLELKIQDIGTEIDDKESLGKSVEIAIQIAPHWHERIALQKRIESLGDLPDASEVSVDRLERVNQKVGVLEARIKDTSERMQDIRDEGDAIPLDNQLLDFSCRVEAFGEHAPWMESLERQIGRLRTEVRELQEEIGVSAENTPGYKGQESEFTVGEVNSRTLSVLKSPAKNLKNAQQELDQCTHAQKVAKEQLETSQEELDSLLIELECEDFDSAIDQAGLYVNQLKRAKQVDERINRLDLQRRQLEEEIDEANEAQIMPVGRTFFVGLFIVFGIGMAIFGFAGALIQSMTPNPFLGMFGVVVAMAGWVIKLIGDSRAQRHLERTQRQYELLLGQIQRARTERDELDIAGSDQSRHIDERLADAEDDLLRLEELIPMREEVETCRINVSESEHALEEAADQLALMQSRWEKALHDVHLPESLTPARVKAISAQSAKFGDKRQRLASCRKELTDRQEELARLGDRVKRVAEDMGVEADDDHPHLLIERMGSILSEQRQLKERRGDLIKQYKTIRKTLRTQTRQKKRLEAFRKRLLTSVGVNHDKSYRELAVQIAQRDDLVERTTNIEKQINLSVGKNDNRQSLIELVESKGEGGLDPYWETLQKDIEALEKRLAELHELRGQRTHEMRTLGDDRSVDELEVQAETIRRQIRRATNKWKQLAVTNTILDSLRRRYEEERQPETLNEASKYLGMITGGKYIRIWTRLEGDVLFVDQNEGPTLRVDVLSQGTREAIFLSLRLALASAYARRGIQFPLVLDDLLVNYDAERTRAAAKVLFDYARKGRQVVFFTCHDHIRDLFHSMDADVRVLPAQRDVIEHEATAERYHVESWEAESDPALETDVELEEVDELLDEDVENEDVENEEVVDEELEEDEFEEGEVEDDAEAYDEDDASDELEEDEYEEEEVEEEEAELEASDEDAVAELIVNVDTMQEPNTAHAIEKTVNEIEALLQRDEPAVIETTVPAEPEPPLQESTERRKFTWESPEMWWE